MPSRRVVESVSQVTGIASSSKEANPADGLYVFYKKDSAGSIGHAGFVLFEGGKQTILHNGRDEFKKENVNERTSNSRDFNT